MAQDSSDGVTWFISIPSEHIDVLGSIRHWENLKMAVDGQTVWVKDFTTTQIESAEVKIIPYKEVFYSRGPKLFPHGSGLPGGTVPSLLWSPIERGIQVQLPAFNHNYFGVQEKVETRIVRVEREEEPVAMLIGLSSLKEYLSSAPAVRSEKLQWTVVGPFAMVMGTPILPVKDNVLWQRGGNLLPAGYDFELPAIAESLEKHLSEGGTKYLLWHPDSSYTAVPKNNFRQLSLSGFRDSLPG